MFKPVQLDLFAFKKRANSGVIKPKKLSVARENALRLRAIERVKKMGEKALLVAQKIEAKKSVIRTKISAYELAWRVINSSLSSRNEIRGEAWAILRILSPPKKERGNISAGFYRVHGATVENPKTLELRRLTEQRANRFVLSATQILEWHKNQIRGGL